MLNKGGGLKMKKLLLIILLTLISTGAMAEWNLADYTDEVTFYFETTSIRKKADIATLWVLSDYKKPVKISNNPYLSDKSKVSYDCENESRKFLSIIQYEENMGKGKVVRDFDYSDTHTYSAVPPGSVDATLMKIACGMK